jgi:glycosyltransferase involved in cell wall biosynthesis
VPLPCGRLRILIVHPSALLTDHRPHGDGLVAFGFIRELANRGHELHVAAEHVDLRDPLPANVHLHVLGEGAGPAPFDRVEFMWRLRRLHRRLRPFDLVHQLNPVEVGLTLAVSDAPTPVVLGPYVPEWPGFRKPGGKVVRPLVLRLNQAVRAAQQQRATTVLLSTPAAASRVAIGIPSRVHVRLVSPGIDDHTWVPPSDDRGERTQDVLFLANLTPRKGVLVLLEAFAEVADALPAARLRIAGDGPLQAEVLRRAQGSERVELLGAVERSHALTLMQECAVYCAPSLGEPFGMTALEAMACAKPVVATNSGGLRHLVPDQGGRKVPAGDPGALAAALLELLPDVETRHSMGEHNRRTVEERYAWSRVADALEDAYQEALSGSRTPPGGLSSNR